MRTCQKRGNPKPKTENRKPKNQNNNNNNKLSAGAQRVWRKWKMVGREGIQRGKSNIEFVVNDIDKHFK